MSSATDSGENAVALGPAVLLAIFIGLGVIIFTFLLKWIKQEQTEKGRATNDKPDKAKGSSTDASGKHGKKEHAGLVKSKKKHSERETRRTARANEKGFNHPWLLATLKGHTGRVLDMDFSANGKYLVSCGDEDPDPGGVPSQTPPTSDSFSSSSSESNKENSLPPSSTPSPIMNKGLSRRQRKNRKRDSHTPTAESKTEKERDSKVDQTKTNKKSKNAVRSKNGDCVGAEALPVKHAHRHLETRGRVRNLIGHGHNLQLLDEFKRMTMPEESFVQILKNQYSLSKEAMAILGYPLRPEMGLLRRKYEFHRMHSPIQYYYAYYLTDNGQHNLDVHAEVFIPKTDSGDSGNGSSSSSEEESSSGSEGVEETSNAAPKLAPGTIKWKDARTHICARCGTFFHTTSKKYITKDKCLYHPGKIETLNGAYGPMNHSCCRQPNGSPGCDAAELHVWAGPKEPIDRTVFVWEAKDLENKDRKSLRINVEFDYATHVKWSPDCKAFIIHRFNENCLEVYKVDKKKDGWLTASKAVTFPKAHETDVIGMGIASSGKFIMTCSNKTDMVIWDLKGEKLAKFDTFLMSTTCAKISPCGRFVLASGFTPEAKTWEVVFDKSGEFKEVKQVPQLTLGGHTSGVYDVAFDVDSSHMATVSKDGTWRLFDTSVNYKHGQDARLDRSGHYELSGSNSLVALSPNAEVLVVATASDLQFFSTLTGELDYAIENISNEHITNVLFHASGKYLLASLDKQIRVFHNVTGYRCNIAHAKEKLKEHQTSATKERLQQLIKDSEEFLKNLEEK